MTVVRLNPCPHCDVGSLEEYKNWKSPPGIAGTPETALVLESAVTKCNHCGFRPYPKEPPVTKGASKASSAPSPQAKASEAHNHE